MEYNHDRQLEEFAEDLDLIRSAGFKPIAVTQMLLEETFVFETDEEAKKAYEILEDSGDCKVVGWWYGRQEFLDEVRNYEEQREDIKVRIHWLNDNEVTASQLDGNSDT